MKTAQMLAKTWSGKAKKNHQMKEGVAKNRQHLQIHRIKNLGHHEHPDIGLCEIPDESAMGDDRGRRRRPLMAEVAWAPFLMNSEIKGARGTRRRK